MGFFDSGSNQDNKFKDELQILATNIEVLNQKILRNPEAGISPGETLIKKEIAKVEVSVARVKESLAQYVGQMNVISQRNSALQSNFDKTAKEVKASVEGIKNLSVNSGAIDNQARQLQAVVANLQTVNREWLRHFLDRVEFLNTNVSQLNAQLGATNKYLSNVASQVTESVEGKINDMSNRTTTALSKNLMYYIIAIIVLSFIVPAIVTVLIRAIFGA